MFLIIRIAILVGLVRLLTMTGKPFLCSGIYAAIALFFDLLSGSGPIDALISGGVAFLLASLYFWLLNRYDEGALYWIILVGGLLIGLV